MAPSSCQTCPYPSLEGLSGEAHAEEPIHLQPPGSRIWFSAMLVTLPGADTSIRRIIIPQSQRQHRVRWQREASLDRITSRIQSAGPRARCGPLVASYPCLSQRHWAVEKAHKPSVGLVSGPAIPCPRELFATIMKPA